ncbi:hypothetical protein [Mycoplasmopsis agalactiae]|uniref:Lipoprotein n=1 Tax=Mycoplasmopsis agalactiae TaxID=2110 RepID=D3VR95_MYCAA|nr:hypothetical protein [Mycoplasmopsis agalactiae]CBH40842.1 Hypothetical protein, predicted lipoprotein [Mycoplasmopsis agalactiae]
MKRKLILIGGGLAFASSFSMIAASCDGKTKEAEKEIKEPVKKETEQHKTESALNEAPKKETAKKIETTDDVSLKASSEKITMSDSNSALSTSANNVTALTNTKDSNDDLEAVRASNYIYDVWARDIYKYQPTEKTPVAKDPNKEQEEKAEKSAKLNLVSRDNKTLEENQKGNTLVTDWLKNTTGKGYGVGRVGRQPVTSYTN